MSVLIAGHDSIEFGWLVMTWIPRLRYKAQFYDKVVIVCKPGHEYLYEDFAHTFHHFAGNGRVDRWLYHDKLVKIPGKVKKKYPDATTWAPSFKTCMQYRHKTYVQYGEYVPELHYEIVIHARATNKYRQQNRNWPVHNYEKVLAKLGNPKACSIGTEAYHIPGTDDKRGVSLQTLCNIMRSSSIMIGPSSGPCHLSNLCGLPLVVWTENKMERSIRTTNKARYKRLWHAFDIPVKVIDGEGWQPKTKTIAKVLRRLLG